MRSDTRAALRGMDPNDCRRLSPMIHDRVIALPVWVHGDDVLLFDSMPEEVDTGPLIATASREGKRVYLPRIHGDEIHFHLLVAADLEPHSYGIMEPPADAPMWSPAVAPATARQTVVICPGLAFDGHGGRLGRGKGFYDQFVSAAREAGGGGEIAFVAICFEIQLVDSVPTGPSDQRMDTVITESRTIETFDAQ